MATKILLLERGAVQSPSFERWHLIAREDGSHWVEHTRWTGERGEDPKLITITVSAADFLATSDDDELKTHLTGAIRSRL